MGISYPPQGGGGGGSAQGVSAAVQITTLSESISESPTVVIT